MEGTVNTNDKTGLEDLFRFISMSSDNSSAKDAVRDLYDTLTPTYDKGAEKMEYKGPEKMVAILKEYCPNTSIDILECGAGTGVVGEKLHADGYKNIVGIDISQKSVDFAKQKGVYKKLICADIGVQKLAFNDGDFDVLICCGCIAPAHIPPTCFPEWTRVVKPGGYIIIILRRCYVDLQTGEENYYSKALGQIFNTEIHNLEESETWEVILRETFPGYCYDKGIVSDGLAVVCKIL